MRLRGNQNGFVALISVLVIGAIGASVAVAILLFGVISTQNGQVLQESARARYLADSCAEIALQRLLRDPSYAGGESVEFGGGVCDITSVNHVGEGVVEFRTSGTFNSVVRRVEVRTSQLRPHIQISLWQEVE